jgi:quinol monooxygenase YgiN
MNDNRVSVFASFNPKPGAEKQVEEILRRMVAPTRQEPGCITYDLYRAQTGSSYHLFEVYRDQAAVEAHRATDHYKTYRSKILDLLAEPIGVTVLNGVDARR